MGDRESSSFRMRFKRPKQRQGTVYRAECPWVVGRSDTGEDDDSSKDNSINAMIIGSPSEAAHMNLTGTAEFPFQHVVKDPDILVGPNVGTGQYIVGVGDSSMIPLGEWLRDVTTVQKLGGAGVGCWEYLRHNKLKGLNKEARKVGRWLGAAIFKHHQDGKFVGDFLPHAFVGKDGLYFSQIGQPNNQQNITLVQGMRRDLLHFQDFIRSFERRCAIHNAGYRQPQHHYHRAVLDLADNLCSEASNLDNYPDLRNLSYLVTHAPLFWEPTQRKDFCTAIYLIHEKREDWKNHIHRYLNYNCYDNEWKTNFMDTLNKTPSLIAYLATFNHLQPRYSNDYPYTLLLLHRSYYIHLRENEIDAKIPCSSFESVDETLQQYFPGIVPIAWNKLYWNLRHILGDLIEELRNHAGMLDYYSL